MVVLHKSAIDPERREPLLVVSFGEPPPRIAMTGGVDNLNGDTGHYDLHTAVGFRPKFLPSTR